MGQVKGKVHPITCHKSKEGEWRCSSTLSLPSALDVGEWLTPRPGCFTPDKSTRYPFYRRLYGPGGRSGRVREISPPLGFDPRTVKPAAVTKRIPAVKRPRGKTDNSITPGDEEN